MKLNPKTAATKSISRRQTLALLGAAAAAGVARPLLAQTGTDWPAIEAKARGQTVYFNAWAGSDKINSYLQWAGAEVQKRYGVKLEHVKVTETVEAVKRVRGEKAAGKLSGGTVDLVWINGENFLAMKREALLFGPFAESLPSYQYVDVVGKPTTRIDFSEPVQGLEMPWGMAQLTFFADSKRVPAPPRSMPELLAFARAHAGRVTYPRPPNFHGMTFIKQALVEVNADSAALYQPVTPEALARAAAPLWAYLDALHPHLWRGGKQFVQNAAAMRQMMSDGELLLAFTFNPNEAANEIAAKRLVESVVSYQFNPYIATAAALGSGLWGIENKIEPTKAVEGNAYDQTFPEKYMLPSTLTEAAGRLRKSKAAHALFGTAFVEHFAQSREWEEREFRKAITDWELSRYFEII